MAIYRQVHISFWQDPFVLDLTPEEKYFYLYLMTNSKTTQCGIYEIPKRIMVLETGYNLETIEKLIQKFINYSKIEYDPNTNEIFLKNWLKYNYSNSPKVISCIAKELTGVKSNTHLKSFEELIKQYGYNINTVSILKRNNNKNNKKNNNNNSEPEKFPFVTFWNLYDYKKERPKAEAKWNRLSDEIKAKIMEHLPLYVNSTPEKKFRKYPSTYLNNECWNDEIILPSSNKSTVKTETGRIFPNV